MEKGEKPRKHYLQLIWSNKLCDAMMVWGL